MIIPETAAQVGAYAGIFIAAIITTCWSIVVLLRWRQRHVLRIGASVLEAYTFIGIISVVIIGVVVFVSMGESLTSEEGDIRQAGVSASVPALSRNPEIDDRLRQIGAKDDEIAKFSTNYVDNYEEKVVENQHGMYSYYSDAVSGKFLYGELSLKSGLNDQEELTITAHEYLHHIWYASLDKHSQDNLTSHLIGMYGRNSYMIQRVAGYDRAGTLSASELFSYYCTEVSDGYLTDYVLETCNEYINRGALQLYI